MGSIDSERKRKLIDTNLVDWSVFSEILQMDEDEEDFSKQLVETFVNQVKDTFEKIRLYLEQRDLEKLSTTGHFLKGSAAALGFTAISSQCERIQNYGVKLNFDDFKLSNISSKSPDSVTRESTNTQVETIVNRDASNISPKDGVSMNRIKEETVNKQFEKSHQNSTVTNRDTSTDTSITPSSSSNIPDEELSDDFWIALIEDAFSKAKDGFIKSKEALDEFFEQKN
ncbi:YPD1 [Candida oxycetoniae]|uniref:YPD1 n=1 Tax=Candida oxycetoniae TaxID=497107 RepID=A0AAI9WWB3_9ASCO|nr:YPD1 [Candida oxycetoniae]KAI3402768.2 YPD1 [Candida oxycetoniae]